MAFIYIPFLLGAFPAAPVFEVKYFFTRKLKIMKKNASRKMSSLRKEL